MQLAAPELIFPNSFCCNCGDTNCMPEIQDTRVTRLFGIGGTQTTFLLGIPVCAACRKSTRRRPSGWFLRALVWALTTCVLFGVLIAIGANTLLPAWLSEHLFAWAAGLALPPVVLFYRLRRPKPPRTSYYQPVRIKQASVQFGDGYARVVFMKLAFTNPEYLHVFSNANREAIQSRRIAAVTA